MPSGGITRLDIVFAEHRAWNGGNYDVERDADLLVWSVASHLRRLLIRAGRLVCHPRTLLICRSNFSRRHFFGHSGHFSHDRFQRDVLDLYPVVPVVP